MFSFHLPGFMYRVLPWIYIGAGIVTVIKLPGILGMVSGLLLMVSGVLVLKWRKPSAPRQRTRTATRPRKQQARRRRNQNGHAAPAHRSGHSAPRRVDANPASSRRTETMDELSEPVKQNGDINGQSAAPGTSRLDRRRGTTDRRSWRPMPQTPFLDSKHVVVTKDRRKTPDRRTGNIVVEEL